MESLIFLVEKHDGRVTARFCANGSPQRAFMERDDAASLTAMTESILITATIDAKQKRDVMTTNILNAFVQTDVDKKNQLKGECIIMKIRGPLVDMLLEIAPEGYEGAILDLQRQDQGLVHQDAQSNLWHVAIILVILQEVLQRH
jgi:hypothetical protein